MIYLYWIRTKFSYIKKIKKYQLQKIFYKINNKKEKMKYIFRMNKNLKIKLNFIIMTKIIQTIIIKSKKKINNLIKLKRNIINKSNLIRVQMEILIKAHMKKNFKIFLKNRIKII